jgi:hypothetical protein
MRYQLHDDGLFISSGMLSVCNSETWSSQRLEANAKSTVQPSLWKRDRQCANGWDRSKYASSWLTALMTRFLCHPSPEARILCLGTPGMKNPPMAVIHYMSEAILDGRLDFALDSGICLRTLSVSFAETLVTIPEDNRFIDGVATTRLIH